METSLGRRCIICGAIIADDNPDGIGYTCRGAYNRAKFGWYSMDENERYTLWQYTVDTIMNIFIATFDTVKFRSLFKKKFYPSIVEQYKETKRISRKQLNICEEMLCNKIPETYYQLSATIKEGKREIVELYMHEFFQDATAEELKEFAEFVRKNYQSRDID